MSRLPKVLLTICLFVLDILYSYYVVLLLKRFGIDVLALSGFSKYMVLIYIDLSFMFILFLIYRKSLVNDFISYFRNLKSNLSIGFKYWIIGLVIMFISNMIIYFISGSNGSANEEIIQSNLESYPIYMVFATVIFAPFVEELIFRKSIRDFINNEVVFVLLSGFIFGYVHTLAGDSSQLLYTIPYGALGCCLAYMYVKTNNIFTSITFHLIHNGIIVFVSLLSYGVI